MEWFHKSRVKTNVAKFLRRRQKKEVSKDEFHEVEAESGQGSPIRSAESDGAASPSSAGDVAKRSKFSGVSRRIEKGVPILTTGTHGPARSSLTNLLMQDVWTMFDNDHDGWLTEDQLKQALESVGVQLSNEEFKELIREVQDDLELWTDSEDSPAPSGCPSVQSDAEDEETVYEDADGNIKVLYNEPKDCLRRLMLTPDGLPVWEVVPAEYEKLDRDEPEQIDFWVAATSTPGLSLDDTLTEMEARKAFLKRVYKCQLLHEHVRYENARERFTEEWNDRSLDQSDSEDNLRQLIQKLTSASFWKRLFGFGDDFKKRLQQLQNAEQEMETKRKNNALKISSVAIKPRPVLQRITKDFVNELLELDEVARDVKYKRAFQRTARGATDIDMPAIMKALRHLGAPANTTEVVEMVDEVTQQSEHDIGTHIEIDTFCSMVEWLFQAVVDAGKVDRIFVTVVEASDLPVMDRFGSADPFATAEIVGRADTDRKKTSVKRGTLNPAWNEELKLLSVKPDDILLISAWDFEDSGFGASLIGEFRVFGQEIHIGEQINHTTRRLDKWFDLLEEDGSPVIGKYGGHAKLHCRISYITGTLAELKQRPVGITADFHIVLLRVEAAEHLPNTDKAEDDKKGGKKKKKEKSVAKSSGREFIDPYCMVLYGDQKYHTRTCKQTQDPVWDQAFQIIASDLGGEIVLSLYDWLDDGVGKDDTLGTCKVFLNALESGEQQHVLDLRSVEDNSLVVGYDGQRSKLRVSVTLTTSEELKLTKSPMEMVFVGIGCDHVETVRTSCSALWQLLQDDEDFGEREGLHLMDDWQTLANVLLTGVLDIHVMSAKDLPRMDYLGLCDPYLVIEVDGLVKQTQTLYKTLAPAWDERIKIPLFLAPEQHHGPKTTEKSKVVIKVYDWDKIGDHDLIGSFEFPIEAWEFGGPEQEEWTLLGEPEKQKSIATGGHDTMVRKPIIGMSGRQTTVQMKVSFAERAVVDEQCHEEVAWAIAFAVINHSGNAAKFAETTGGIAGLIAMLKHPVKSDSAGEALQGAAYALGNLGAAHPPTQNEIANQGGVGALVSLANFSYPPQVQRAACLALGSLLADNRTVIQALVKFRPAEVRDDLVQRCGGLGMLFVLVRDARPDAGTLQKAGGDSAWDEVAKAVEAAVQAISSACFVNPGSGFFGASRREMERVALSVGRPGLLILKELTQVPVKSSGGKRATQEAVRFARLCAEGLEVAFGMA